MEEHGKATHNLGDGQQWLRILYIILFFMVKYVANLVFWILVLFQIAYNMIAGKLNARIQRFADSLSLYIGQILRYCSYISDDKPFPFDDWPQATASYAEPEVPLQSQSQSASDDEKESEK